VTLIKNIFFERAPHITNHITRLANKLRSGSVPQVGTQKAPFIQMVLLRLHTQPLFGS